MRVPTCDSDTHPAARVAAAFERIARERMADVPLCNRALAVESVGFRRWNGLWVGVLVTPWAMNLMLLPAGHAAFAPLAVGQVRAWDLPSGAYEFMGGDAPGVGPFHCCALFSPMNDFATQGEARATAAAVMDTVLAAPPEVAPPAVDRRAFLRRALGRPGAA